MTVLNDLDRFHLVMDAVDRLPQTGGKGIYLKQQLKEKLIEHKQYIGKYGEDLPEIRELALGYAAGRRQHHDLNSALPLNEDGRGQGRELGASLTVLRSDRILSSPLQRARSAAEGAMRRCSVIHAWSGREM